jgi:molecular chaperone GrpE
VKKKQRRNWFAKKSKPPTAMKEETKDKKAEKPADEGQPQAEEQEVNEQVEETQTETDPAEASSEATEQSEQAEQKEAPGSIDEAMETVAHLQLQLRDTRNQLQQSSEQLLRLQAEFQNFRKRKEKETAQQLRFANEDLLKTLLPILDNFDRTLEAIEKTDNLTAIKEGIQLVDASMKRQLKKTGLEPIESKGKPFDPAFHEAITTVPVDDEAMKGQVIDEIEKGYQLKDRVIRFSKVIVGE